jgi:hypothetical protein
MRKRRNSGAVFVTAKQAKAAYAALGIEKREIERRQPWQSDIETNFNALWPGALWTDRGSTGCVRSTRRSRNYWSMRPRSARRN